MSLGNQAMSIVNKVREKTPLIHHLTNQVVMNFTANGLLAYGGSPIMAKERQEVAEMASISDGVLINIGTLVDTELEAMIIAGKSANNKGIPLVLDPVGVAATNFRKKAIEQLLDEVSFTAIKGNAGEMAYLVDVAWETKGVESSDGDVAELENIARKIAKKYETIAIITGETDVISDGVKTKQNKTGHIMLTKITGAGCLLGSIVAASIAVGDSALEASYEAVEFYGAAAERAVKQASVNGTGTFIPAFLDELQT